MWRQYCWFKTTCFDYFVENESGRKFNFATAPFSLPIIFGAVDCQGLLKATLLATTISAALYSKPYFCFHDFQFVAGVRQRLQLHPIVAWMVCGDLLKIPGKAATQQNQFDVALQRCIHFWRRANVIQVFWISCSTTLPRRKYTRGACACVLPALTNT